MKVADFGIAKTAGSEPTASGQIMGTMGYVSPHRLEGKPATVLDDVYRSACSATRRSPSPTLQTRQMAALARAILRNNHHPSRQCDRMPIRPWWPSSTCDDA